MKLGECSRQMEVPHLLLCVTESSDLDLSLDQFLARNTSEDNASFSELMKENDQKHKVKHAWLFEKEQQQDQVSALTYSFSCHN